MGSAPERAGYDGKNHQYGNHQTYDPNKGSFGILMVFALSGHTEPSRNSKYIINYTIIYIGKQSAFSLYTAGKNLLCVKY